MDYRAAVDWLVRYGQYARERASEPGILSQFMHGLVDLPHDVYTGAKTGVSPAETMGWSLNAMTPAMPFAETGAAGIFGGRLAKTADLKALKFAEQMEAGGADRGAIWEATGWGRGKDGKWRFEINDQGMKANLEDKALESKWGEDPKFKGNGDRYTTIWPTYTMGEAFNHPDLFTAYPDLAEIQLRKETSGAMGSYVPGSIRLESPTDTSTALHELQHAVQRQEGFSTGANPRVFEAPSNNPELQKYDRASETQDLIWRRMDALLERRRAGENVDAEIQQLRTASAKLAELKLSLKKRADPFAKYRSVAGEVEARNVQHRQNWGPATRLENPPWATESVHRSDQIDFNNATHRQQVIDDFLQKYNSGQLL